MGYMVNATPRPLYPWERLGTDCIGGWVHPWAGLDGCGKYRLHWDSIPGSRRELLRRIYGPVVVQGIWRIRTDQALTELCRDLDIVADLK